MKKAKTKVIGQGKVFLAPTSKTTTFYNSLKREILVLAKHDEGHFRYSG